MEDPSRNASPDSASQTVLPSPTYSDSVTSSNSHLCTPVSSAEFAKGLREEYHPSFSAANAAFRAATSFDNGMDKSDPSSLSFALDFQDPNTYAAAPSKRNGAGNGSHSRANSASRRHSIQPLMAKDGSNPQLDLSFLSQHLQLDGSAVGLPSNEDFDFMATFTNQDQSEFLMSPPRLTVSMPGQGDASAADSTRGGEQSKRHRLAPSDAQGEENQWLSKSVGQSPSMPSLGLETPQKPPHVHFLPYGGHRDSTASMQTPFSDKTASSVNGSIMGSASSTASERSVRRRSIDIHGGSPGMNRLAPSGLLGRRFLDQVPEPPKSAPPEASFNAMQLAQDAASKQIGLKMDDKSDPKNAKGGDVWPDDVEVAFWEGKCSSKSSAYIHSLPEDRITDRRHTLHPNSSSLDP